MPQLARVYRQLLRACDGVSPEHFGYSSSNLVEHATMRVRTEKAIDLGNGDHEVPIEKLEEAERQMKRITSVLEVMHGMSGSDAPSLFSFLAACQTGAGGPEYFRELEDGFLRVASFHDDFQERLLMEKERGGDMKNRAMQVTARDYTEILTLMEEHGAQCEEHIVQIHSNSNKYFYTLPDVVVVDVDHEREKVIIYIKANTDIRDNAMDEHVPVMDWNMEPSGTSFTEEHHLAAVGITKQIIEDNIIPEGYGIIMAGHSSGGAIACIVAVYLNHQHNKNIFNVITFGQPMVTTTIGNPGMTELPLLRIFTPLDGFVHTPTGSSTGNNFVHYGEQLSILPSKLRDLATPDWIDENMVYVTMAEYQTLLQDDAAVLEYEDRPSILPGWHGYGDITHQDESEIPKGELSHIIRKRKMQAKFQEATAGKK